MWLPASANPAATREGTNPGKANELKMCLVDPMGGRVFAFHSVQQTLGPANHVPAVTEVGATQGQRRSATETVRLPAPASPAATREGTYPGKANERKTCLGESRGGKAFAPHPVHQTLGPASHAADCQAGRP